MVVVVAVGGGGVMLFTVPHAHKTQLCLCTVSDISGFSADGTDQFLRP